MKNPLKYRSLSLAITLAVVIVGIILSAMTQRMVFIIPGAAAVVVYPLLGIVFWRCPHCKKNLPIYGGNIKLCPYCGKPLDEPESIED